MAYALRDKRLKWMLPLWNVVLNFMAEKAEAQCHSNNARDGGEAGDSDSDSDSDSDNDSSSSRTSSRARTQCSTSTSASTSATSGVSPSVASGTISSTSTASGAHSSSTVAILDNTSGDHIHGGSIAGIVIGILLFLLLLFFLVWFFRRRYEKLRSLDSKSSIRRNAEIRVLSESATTGLIGAAATTSGGTDRDKGRIHHESTSSIDSHIFLPNPHPRDLPPLPPLEGDDSTPSMAQRNSVVLTYIPPPASNTNSCTALSRGQSVRTVSSIVTGGTGRRSLHEDMVAHQKDLEANYRMSERDNELMAEASGSGLAVIDEHPSEPPPQYME